MLPDHVAAWIADANTERFLEVSEPALELFGYTRLEFLQLKPADIVCREEWPQLDQARQTAPEHWGLGHWWTCRRKDGSRVRIQIRFHMQQYNDRYCYVVLLANLEQAKPTSSTAL